MFVLERAARLQTGQSQAPASSLVTRPSIAARSAQSSFTALRTAHECICICICCSARKVARVQYLSLLRILSDCNDIRAAAGGGETCDFCTSWLLGRTCNTLDNDNQTLCAWRPRGGKYPAGSERFSHKHCIYSLPAPSFRNIPLFGLRFHFPHLGKKTSSMDKYLFQ